MKKFTHITFALFAVFFATVAANAQAVTQGTVNFSVSVADAFDLRAAGPSTFGPMTTSGFSTGTNSVANTQLGITLSVGDASPNVDNSTLEAVVPIQMRSNRTYKLTASCGTCLPDSPADFDSTDIGMSIGFLSRSGINVNPGTDNVNATYAVGGGGTVGGLTSTPTTIANGDRISNQGDNSAGADNSVKANLTFKIKRQYYTPGTFTESVTLGIAAP